jgi:hypothetical protein
LAVHRASPAPEAVWQARAASDFGAISYARDVLRQIHGQQAEPVPSVTVGREGGGGELEWLGAWEWQDGPRWRPDE